jgi:hypothetical protein
LAHDSEVLAQQFTIVEKDALDEIDWKELIELRWKQSSPQIRDWVQYLRTEEARGVDVVIARFNLVVKWVVSEVLLTEDIHERARCITKFIHIATHARRYRNYATMYQIAIALISNDVSSLKKTWALVPAAEMLVMTELEALVQPLKNFHNLRLEMETATVDDGCIPFIGSYHLAQHSFQKLTDPRRLHPRPHLQRTKARLHRRPTRRRRTPRKLRPPPHRRHHRQEPTPPPRSQL